MRSRSRRSYVVGHVQGAHEHTLAVCSDTGLGQSCVRGAATGKCTCVSRDEPGAALLCMCGIAICRNFYGVVYHGTDKWSTHGVAQMRCGAR